MERKVQIYNKELIREVNVNSELLIVILDLWTGEDISIIARCMERIQALCIMYKNWTIIM